MKRRRCEAPGAGGGPSRGSLGELSATPPAGVGESLEVGLRRPEADEAGSGGATKK